MSFYFILIFDNLSLSISFGIFSESNIYRATSVGQALGKCELQILNPD